MNVFNQKGTISKNEKFSFEKLKNNLKKYQILKSIFLEKKEILSTKIYGFSLKHPERIKKFENGLELDSAMNVISIDLLHLLNGEIVNDEGSPVDREKYVFFAFNFSEKYNKTKLFIYEDQIFIIRKDLKDIFENKKLIHNLN